MERQQTRCIWATGRKGITEAEAARLIVLEARQIVQAELGISGVAWQKHEHKDDPKVETAGEESRRDEESRTGVGERTGTDQTKQKASIPSDHQGSNAPTKRTAEDLSRESIKPSTAQQHDGKNGSAENVRGQSGGAGSGMANSKQSADKSQAKLHNSCNIAKPADMKQTNQNKKGPQQEIQESLTEAERTNPCSKVGVSMVKSVEEKSGPILKSSDGVEIQNKRVPNVVRGGSSGKAMSGGERRNNIAVTAMVHDAPATKDGDIVQISGKKETNLPGCSSIRPANIEADTESPDADVIMQSLSPVDVNGRATGFENIASGSKGVNQENVVVSGDPHRAHTAKNSSTPATDGDRETTSSKDKNTSPDLFSCPLTDADLEDALQQMDMGQGSENSPGDGQAIQENQESPGGNAVVEEAVLDGGADEVSPTFPSMDSQLEQFMAEYCTQNDIVAESASPDLGGHRSRRSPQEDPPKGSPANNPVTHNGVVAGSASPDLNSEGGGTHEHAIGSEVHFVQNAQEVTVAEKPTIDTFQEVDSTQDLLLAAAMCESFDSFSSTIHTSPVPRTNAPIRTSPRFLDRSTNQEKQSSARGTTLTKEKDIKKTSVSNKSGKIGQNTHSHSTGEARHAGMSSAGQNGKNGQCSKNMVGDSPNIIDKSSSFSFSDIPCESEASDPSLGNDTVIFVEDHNKQTKKHPARNSNERRQNLDCNGETRKCKSGRPFGEQIKSGIGANVNKLSDQSAKSGGESSAVQSSKTSKPVPPALKVCNQKKNTSQRDESSILSPGTIAMLDFFAGEDDMDVFTQLKEPPKSNASGQTVLAGKELNTTASSRGWEKKVNSTKSSLHHKTKRKSGVPDDVSPPKKQKTPPKKKCPAQDIILIDSEDPVEEKDDVPNGRHGNHFERRTSETGDFIPPTPPRHNESTPRMLRGTQNHRSKLGHMSAKKNTPHRSSKTTKHLPDLSSKNKQKPPETKEKQMLIHKKSSTKANRAGPVKVHSSDHSTVQKDRGVASKSLEHKAEVSSKGSHRTEQSSDVYRPSAKSPIPTAMPQTLESQMLCQEVDDLFSQAPIDSQNDLNMAMDEFDLDLDLKLSIDSDIDIVTSPGPLATRTGQPSTNLNQSSAVSQTPSFSFPQSFSDSPAIPSSDGAFTIVDVCANVDLFQTFISEWKRKKRYSVAVACEKYQVPVQGGGIGGNFRKPGMHSLF